MPLPRVDHDTRPRWIFLGIGNLDDPVGLMIQPDISRVGVFRKKAFAVLCDPMAHSAFRRHTIVPADRQQAFPFR